MCIGLLVIAFVESLLKLLKFLVIQIAFKLFSTLLKMILTFQRIIFERWFIIIQQKIASKRILLATLENYWRGNSWKNKFAFDEKIN